MEELVTIATFNNLHEAYLSKARLEADGISCFIRDEFMNSILPVHSLGGVKLEVAVADAARAFNILFDITNQEEGIEL
jgi:hypothetical protein